MATDAEIRAWLNGNGHEVGARGRLTAEHRRIFMAGQQQDDDWDLPGDQSGDVATADETEPSVPLEPEKPPGTPRSAKRARRQPVGARLFGGGQKKSSTAKPKKKLPRVPVDHLITRVWEGVARVAAPVSLPVSRCLQVQSPVAGMILEDIVKGTVVDTALQPIARAEEKAEKVLALVAPPVLVLALEQTLLIEDPQRQAMRQAILMPMLRETLRIWVQVAGPKVEEAAKREAEYQETYGRTIDEMIQLFFGQGASTEAEQAEPEMAGASA